MWPRHRSAGQYRHRRNACRRQRFAGTIHLSRTPHHGTPPQPPDGCTGPSFGVLKGAGVFRFQDGSLFIVTLKDGTGCVNLAERVSVLIVNYQNNGGTGRFRTHPELTMTATQTPVLRNATNAPALLPITGRFEGTILDRSQETTTATTLRRDCDRLKWRQCVGREPQGDAAWLPSTRSMNPRSWSVTITPWTVGCVTRKNVWKSSRRRAAMRVVRPMPACPESCRHLVGESDYCQARFAPPLSKVRPLPGVCSTASIGPRLSGLGLRRKPSGLNSKMTTPSSVW